MMKAVYVPAARTPLSFEEAAKVMEAALFAVLNERPKTETLALALAKTALETGRWQQIWNDNWGNIKAGPDYVGQFTCITLNEVLAAGVVWFAPEGQLNRKGGEVIGTRYSVPPGHPQTRMRAYANAYDGAHSYVDFVAGGRYRDAWQQLLAGNAYDYVMALHQKGYFTADPLVYVKAVKSLHQEFIAKLEGLHADPVEPPDCDDVRCLLAPQPWNQAAARAHGQAVATEAYYDMLDQSRRAGIREAAGLEPERHDTEPSPPPTEPPPEGEA
jgi:hypothetical protein